MKIYHIMRRIAALVLCFIPIMVAAFSLTTLGTQPAQKDLKIVIDTDPGADDAMAMMMILSQSCGANVLCITAVQGNTGVANASANALLVLQIANRTHIPVYSGSPQGLVTKESGDNFFGTDGLGDTFQKPSLELLANGHAALAIVEAVKKYPGEVSIVCLGPLTNVALAIHLYPRLLLDVKELLILGGSYRGHPSPSTRAGWAGLCIKGGGNRKPGAEFNFVTDPEAASLVLSKAPQGKSVVTLLPLETVVDNSFSLDWRENVLGAIDSDAMRFLNRAEKISLGKSTKWSPFDPLAAAILLNPAVVTGSMESRVVVETCGRHGRGAMFVDYKAVAKNIRIVTGVDRDLFQNMLLTLLS